MTETPAEIPEKDCVCLFCGPMKSADMETAYLCHECARDKGN